MKVCKKTVLHIEKVRAKLAEEMDTIRMDKVYLFIQVDMDMTLTKDTAWTPAQVHQAEPNHEIINAINSIGHRDVIIIYTARADHLIPATIRWLAKHGVRYDAISNIKRTSHVLIDDRAFNPFIEPCGCKDSGCKMDFP